jgi:hypothetical protein
MQFSQQSNISPESNLINPIITFGIGLFTGAFIGFYGIILLTIGGIAYYYRDPIIEATNNVRNSSYLSNNNFQNTNQPNSLISRGMNVIGLSSINTNNTKRKKMM